jgi:hypothetical protein
MTMKVVANGKFLGRGLSRTYRCGLRCIAWILILKDPSSLKMAAEFIDIKSGNYANEDEVFTGKT